MRLWQEQEPYLYKLLGQISSRKGGGVSAEIAPPIFRGVGEQTAHACANAGFQQLAVGAADLRVRRDYVLIVTHFDQRKDYAANTTKSDIRLPRCVYRP